LLLPSNPLIGRKGERIVRFVLIAQLFQQVKQGFNSLVSLGAWILWKGRNDRVFNGISPNLSRALLLASEEVDLWILASAKGLRRLRSLVVVRNGG
jgi:hypothetical protein